MLVAFNIVLINRRSKINGLVDSVMPVRAFRAASK
jgi:hypothetical protein